MAKKNREVGRAERAAAIRAEQARRERTKRLGITAGILVLLGALIAIAVIYSGSDSSPDPTGKAPVTSSAPQALLMGPASAKHKVVVYEDFLCPYCREFEMSSRDVLYRDAALGRVQVSYRPFHLLQEDYSQRALSGWAAVLQSNPAQALKLHNLLYDKQPYEQAASFPSNAQIASWAQSVGVTDKAVLAKIQGAVDTAYVQAADANAQQAGVNSTPTVFLDGKKLGGSPQDIANQLESVLAK